MSITVASTSFAVFSPRTTSRQLHHVRRREEVHADDVLRALRGRGDPVHVERGGVGGEDRAGLGHAVELAEHFLLDAHLLEDGLDDEVGVLEVLVGERGLEERHALAHLRLGEPPLLHRALVVLADGGEPAVERLLLRLQDGHGDARVEEVHRDAATHGARADHAHLRDGAARRVLGHVGNLRGRALAEERVAQGPRFRAVHEVDEKLALDADALVERLVDGRRHRLDAFQRRGKVLHHGAHAVLREGQERLGIVVLHFPVAKLRERALFRGHLLREGHGALDEVALDDLVQKPRLGELLRGHGVAGDDHVERHFEADGPRQALRAARPGQQADLHFRQRDLRSRARRRGNGNRAAARARRPWRWRAMRRRRAWGSPRKP
jgi:hypothetical protein